jgi:HSP90 family molecular chaperone
LVSNASDAIDKLKFETLSDDSLVEGKENLAVYIDVNKDKKTITITDNGIGMTETEVNKNCKVIEVPKSGQSTFSVEYLPLPFDVHWVPFLPLVPAFDDKDIEYEAVNKANAFWTQDKAELKQEDYDEFYKSLTFDFEDSASSALMCKVIEVPKSGQSTFSVEYLPLPC